MEGGFYREERGKRLCPFPRAPIPETKILHPHGRSSVEKESLSKHEDADLFLGMVKLQPGATSIVDKAGTFLLWYDTKSGECLTTVAHKPSIDVEQATFSYSFRSSELSQPI